MLETANLTRFATVFLGLLLLLPALGSAQSPLADVRSGDLRFTLGKGDAVRLNVRGVDVIRKSTLYIVKPGWTGAFLDQDDLTPAVTQETDGEAKIVNAVYETPDAVARYRYQVGPGATFKVGLTFSKKVSEEAVFEYDAAYLPAGLIAGQPFTADTVDGARSGNVPLVAASEEQEASRVMPFFRTAKFTSSIGNITVSVEGNTEFTRDLNLFDARKYPADWARKYPIYWLGVGSPDRPVAEGDNTITVTWTFGVGVPNVTTPMLEGAPKLTPEPAALVASVPDRPIIPRPKLFDGAGKPVRFDGPPVIVIPDNATAEEKAAAREVLFELKTFWNVRASIVTKSASSRNNGDAPTITLAVQSGDAVLAAPEKAEGYALVADDRSVHIVGYDARGAYNGAQTLKQLLRVDDQGVFVKAATIQDWPSLAFRGVHWFGGPNALPFHQKMLSRIVGPLKMNAMVYQCDYTQWETQPGIWSAERSTPKKDVGRAVEIARNMFIEPIPMVNGMGHAEWLFWNKQNLNIAADPETPYAWDPEKPETYPIVFGVMQEALDLFKPKVFHLGNDEVTMRGKFPPPGSKKTVTELIIEDTTKRHEWLAEKGVKSMMWGDMLLFRGEANDAALAPTAADAKARREALPRDIVLADWHYTGSDPNFKSIPLFQGLGYEVIGCSWFQWNNIRNWVRALVANDAQGLMQTTWAGYSMFPDIVKGQSANQFVAYLVAAEYAWNGGDVRFDELGYSPDDAFQSLWNRNPVEVAPKAGFTVDLSSVATNEMWDWVKVLPGATAKPGVAPFKYGQQRFAGMEFSVGRPVWLAGALNPPGAWPGSLALELSGRTASSISFLWGTTQPAEPDAVVATVKVAYGDGTTSEAPIRYLREISAFDDDRATPDAVSAWRGESPFGAQATVRRWTWQNPDPSKPIKGLVVSSTGTEAAPVLLAVTGVD